VEILLGDIMERFEIYNEVQRCLSINGKIYRPSNDIWNEIDTQTLLLGYLVQFKDIIVVQTNTKLAQTMCKMTFDYFSITGIRKDIASSANNTIAYTSIGLSGIVNGRVKINGRINFYAATDFKESAIRGQTIDVAFLY
jgi:hypothetical protein